MNKTIFYHLLENVVPVKRQQWTNFAEFWIRWMQKKKADGGFNRLKIERYMIS